jgi:putative selenium metabolism protein SsnA
MLLIGNGTLLTLGQDCRVISGGGMLIDKGLIVRIDETSKLRETAPEAKYIDCQGKLIMPGFTCAHTHTYSAFARGINLKGDPPANFPQILKHLWWRLDQALKPEDIYYSALLTFIDCIRNGTTALLDHHSSPNAISGSLEQIAAAARKTGIRANLCYEVSDRDGPEKAKAGIEENCAFISYCQAESSSLITAVFGMHASFTIGSKTMEHCARATHELKSGVHIHAAESREDVVDCHEKYGVGVIERLDQYGLLGPKTLVAHCVHIDDREMDLLASTKTNAAHNPQSNMNNAVGCAPVREMLGRGVLLGMGTDGMTASMPEGMKTAHILHKLCHNDPRAGWQEVPMMQLVNNPIIMNRYFPVLLGELAVGAAADLIVIDYDPPTPLTAENYYSHLVFGVAGSTVETTVIDGKVLMLDRKFTSLDAAEVHAQGRELAAKLWKRF